MERGQERIRCDLNNATNQLIIAGDKNTDRIINYLNQTEMDKLRTELQSAQFQLSQLSQTDNIVNRLMPTPKPAYLTCPLILQHLALVRGANYGLTITTAVVAVDANPLGVNLEGVPTLLPFER